MRNTIIADVLRKVGVKSEYEGNFLRNQMLGIVSDKGGLAYRYNDVYKFIENYDDTKLQEAVSDLQQHTEALQGAMRFIGNIALPSTQVTQSALNNRAQELNRFPAEHGYVLVDADNNDWWYDGGLGEWVDIGGSVVSTATNSSLGIVKGSTDPLMGSINLAGEISINGLAEALYDLSIITGGQTRNLFYASPASSAGVPSFRSIVFSDLPEATTSNKGAVMTRTNFALSENQMSDLHLVPTAGAVKKYVNDLHTIAMDTMSDLKNTLDIRPATQTIVVGVDSDKFYPVAFSGGYTRTVMAIVRINGGNDVRNNAITFLASNGGSTEAIGRFIRVLHFWKYNQEISIHSVYASTDKPYMVIYLRGGITYRVESNIDFTPSAGSLNTGVSVFPLMSINGDFIGPSTAITRLWVNTQGFT